LEITRHEFLAIIDQVFAIIAKKCLVEDFSRGDGALYFYEQTSA
jgi:hypothetical protein